MTSSTKNKVGFASFDYGQFLMVIFSGDGIPGILPSYMRGDSPDSIVIAASDDLAWLELDLKKGINKFKVTSDLLVAGFSFSPVLAQVMDSYYKTMGSRS